MEKPIFQKSIPLKIIGQCSKRQQVKYRNAMFYGDVKK